MPPGYAWGIGTHLDCHSCPEHSAAWPALTHTQALAAPHGAGCCSQQLGLEGPRARYLASAGS